MEFRHAESVERIGRELIEKNHPHLKNRKVVFVFTEKAPKSKGREVWGRATKVSGLPAFLAYSGGNGPSESRTGQQFYGTAPDLFVIQISEPVWEKLPLAGRRALVDHELEHCFVDEDGKLGVIGHDIEEFEAIVKRHGVRWRESLRDFAEVASEQLRLPNAS